MRSLLPGRGAQRRVRARTPARPRCSTAAATRNHHHPRHRSGRRGHRLPARDREEKMSPWMGALEDNLEVLNKTDEQAGDWGRGGGTRPDP